MQVEDLYKADKSQRPEFKQKETGKIRQEIYYARALHCAHGRKAIHCITLSRYALLYGQSNSHPTDNPAQ